MTNTEKFTGLAQVYRKYRPGYPDELFDYLKNTLGLNPKSRTAEVGSGTGIFTGLLLAHGLREIYAVEPNADMRAVAENELGAKKGFHSVDGCAEATGLEDHQFDFIFAVQAFHWFDQPLFREECRRILKPGGKVVIIWNSRVDGPVTQETYEVCRHCCNSFEGFSGGLPKSGDEAVNRFFDGNYLFREFANPVLMNREEFVGRHLSSSYAPREGDAGYQAFIEGVRDIFDRHAVDGGIIWEAAARSYAGTL